MAEAPAERYLTSSVRKRGGLCLKLIIMGMRNFPDRTILLPGPKIFFVECKDVGKDLRKGQAWYAKILRRLGFKVYVCRTKEDVDYVLSQEMAS